MENQNTKSRKTIIVLSILVIIIGGIVAAWLFFVDKEKQNEIISSVSGFLPFGSEVGKEGEVVTPPPHPSDGAERPTGAETGFTQLLRQITDKPTAGAVAFATEDRGVVVRFVERATGHIYETSLNSIQPQRISNTTVPGVHEALLVDNGRGVILRYLKDTSDTIQTFYGKIVPKEGGDVGNEAALEGKFLPENISELAVSPGGSQIFYLENLGFEFRGVVSSPDGGGGREIYRSSYGEWLANWHKENSIFLTTRPSGGAFGYSYWLDTGNGNMQKAIDRKIGLTVLGSPANNIFVFSQNGQGGFGLFVKENGKDETSLKIKTLPEKCLWSKLDKAILYCAVPFNLEVLRGSLPDDWYQGLVSFTDEIKAIDTATALARTLLDADRIPQGATLDATKLFMDEREQFLFFTNKSDQTLWALRLSRPGDIIPEPGENVPAIPGPQERG